MRTVDALTLTDNRNLLPQLITHISHLHKHIPQPS
jgi:hypothetical protein